MSPFQSNLRSYRIDSGFIPVNESWLLLTSGIVDSIDNVVVPSLLDVHKQSNLMYQCFGNAHRTYGKLLCPSNFEEFIPIFVFNPKENMIVSV